MDYIDVEAIMARALTVGVLAGTVVFMGGVLLGWEYALFLGFTVLLAVSLVNWVIGGGKR
jgi:hypothetical protein